MRLLPLAAVLVALVLPASAGAIVGGQPATRSYSHMGALFYDGSFTCGSSLVAPEYVLTAAHCVTEQDGSVTAPSKLKVQLGSHQLSKPGETLAVTAVTREPDYDDGTASYDLALLRLERPARETPIAIAGADDKASWAPGAQATVTGWGVQFWPDPGLTLSDQLREVDVHVQSDDDCAAYAAMVSYDPKTMLCAGEMTGGKDACQGDSGGPLMHVAGSTLTLIGVVSQGTGCGLPTQFGVYARVGEGPLRAWLDSVVPRSAPAAYQAPLSAPAAAKAKPKKKAKPKRKAKHKKRKHKKKRKRHARHKRR